MSTYTYNNYSIRKLTPDDNAQLASLIRYNLKNNGLDIPGTVYFDLGLDTLYDYYSAADDREYYVLINEQNKLVGGIGYADFPGFSCCAELQKLYLDDSVKGQGLGYVLMKYIEDRVREAGYRYTYLETHSNLKIAIHIYENIGYKLIDRPEAVVHNTMDHFYIKDITLNA